MCKWSLQYHYYLTFVIFVGGSVAADCYNVQAFVKFDMACVWLFIYLVIFGFFICYVYIAEEYFDSDRGEMCQDMISGLETDVKMPSKKIGKREIYCGSLAHSQQHEISNNLTGQSS